MPLLIISTGVIATIMMTMMMVIIRESVHRKIVLNAATSNIQIRQYIFIISPGDKACLIVCLLTLRLSQLRDPGINWKQSAHLSALLDMCSVV